MKVKYLDQLGLGNPRFVSTGSFFSGFPCYAFHAVIRLMRVSQRYQVLAEVVQSPTVPQLVFLLCLIIFQAELQSLAHWQAQIVHV
jgi:hypothetical protein